MSIYQNLYALIEQYVYAGVMDEYSTLVATMIATMGCIFVVALPFLVVWKVVKMIAGG